MEKYQFIDKYGTFQMKNPNHYSYLYFPVAGNRGIKSAVTPDLGGDAKLDQNSFILEPVSVENLQNNRSTRNFWCKIKEKGCWSATGVSAEEISHRFTSQEEQTEITAGLMWQKIVRKSNQYGLTSEVTSFVPVEENVEIMRVTLKNHSKEKCEFIPIAAIPIYGRSADNIRDHRHVTSLLHRIRTTKSGVLVYPTLSFDERGHRKNEQIYYVCGMSEKGERPECFYPTVDHFLGEGGNYEHPLAVYTNQTSVTAGVQIDGKEAVGALQFEKVQLEAGEKISYTILIGATDDESVIERNVEMFHQNEKVDQELQQVKAYWKSKVNVSYHTGNEDFDNFMYWVSFQPILRRIYGCSFLPHHDYGKGGRGWRDLWQDCLALLILSPDGVKQLLLDNFGGVRMDGTNATIIGERQGEFLADRNNITRVWMDHGVWPFMTMKLYMDQTGDLNILEKEVTYFKDRQVHRGQMTDERWTESAGNLQRTQDETVYTGTVLEHLLIQNLCAVYEVGAHNQIRLRDADWNDALDMAGELGESVAFTNAYAGNLRDLAACIEMYGERAHKTEVDLAEELLPLIYSDKKAFEDVKAKNELLETYEKSCAHEVSGRKLGVSIKTLCEELRAKALWIMENIRKTQWVTDTKGNGWFNGYYDDHGEMVEGEKESGIRMMLTSQVFSIMAGTATEEEVAQITKSADNYLFDKNAGGYRLNTDFKEVKTDLGRMFGFAYGEKENGAVFSHMAVMYGNALYKRGFVKEGNKSLQALAEQSLDFEKSKIYPSIPEYFDGNGRGKYNYLTGAASWYMLTMITQVFGVYGCFGDLCIEPKLMADQFDENGKAELEIAFAKKEFLIRFVNVNKKEYGTYKIFGATLNGEDCKVPKKAHKIVIDRKEIEKLSLNDKKERAELVIMLE